MSGISTGQSAGQVMEPETGGLFFTPAVLAESSGESLGRHAATGASSNTAAGKATGKSSSRASGRSSGTSRTHSISRAYSETTIEAEMHGSSVSEGTTEGLEPIFAVLPSAVHSKENMLYLAAQTLRSLKTGQAFVNYVGAAGMQAALLRVPRVKSEPLTEAKFLALRTRMLDASPSALLSEEAAASAAG